MSEKMKTYGVWVEDSARPNGGGWVKDGNGRIYEQFSLGAAASIASEWRRPNVRAAEIGDDGLPVDNHDEARGGLQSLPLNNP